MTLSKKSFVNSLSIIEGITRFSMSFSFNWFIKSCPVIKPATVTFEPKKSLLSSTISPLKFSIELRVLTISLKTFIELCATANAYFTDLESFLVSFFLRF